MTEIGTDRQRQTETKIEKQRDRERQRERQSDRQTGRQKDRDRERKGEQCKNGSVLIDLKYLYSSLKSFNFAYK